MEREVILDSTRCHEALIGKLAVVTEFGVELEEQYEQQFGFGDPYRARRLHWWTTDKGSQCYKLMFVDYPTHMIGNIRLFCLQEVGVGIGKHGDWYWFSLDQLLICSED